MNVMTLLRRLSIIAMLLFALPSEVPAQFIGQLTTAENLQPKRRLFGGYLGFYEKVTIVAMTQYRYGFTNFLDGGFQFGGFSADIGEEDEAGIVFGGNIKYRILNAAAGDQFDLSSGIGLETAQASNYHLYSLSGSIIGSFRLQSSSGKLITPYSRMAFHVQNTHWDQHGLHEKGTSDSDFDLGLNLGAQFSLNNNSSIIAELQLENGFFGFIAGINYIK
ncbi:MAG: hypothetical protein CO189_09700 [candidate division Zixibacteria bacterium CG_4_9_14_3_um_filter_46_8]|nr:MAG: hypothetical protein CO189_09700 [candidate division Zixibacteria bacterium CG_4_9_14_3_um_filter_46_8]